MRKKFCRRVMPSRRATDDEVPTSAAQAQKRNILSELANVNLRQNAVERREKAVDRREKAVDRRENAADLRQEIADQRQEIIDLHAKSLREQALAKVAKDELRVETERILREANERLIIATMRAQMMTESAKEATAKMAYMAAHDFLTGLPNRSLLTNRLEQSIGFADRHGKKIALLYIDLDHFKYINDSLGHQIGDHLLQSVAKRLLDGVRQSDTVCRQGGDEFVVLLAEIESVDDAEVFAEKLINALAVPHHLAGHRLHITPSIGIAVYPDDATDSESVVRNADMAMYHAKKKGRNTYAVFRPEMNSLAIERQNIEEELHHALEQHNLILHYQPKINIASGAIVGVEALVRLRRDGQHLVYPASFVTIAEDCNLILPIGKWVLQEACRQTIAWHEDGIEIGLMSVNVSTVEFLGKDFLSGVRSILQETGLDPAHLELELTESGLMGDTELTRNILRALKELGVKIAIDDFGTGFSSLSYLRRFPIDTLKIDQSFVREIEGNSTEGASIIDAIIAMGASLKQKVVAEGVETQEQLDFLRNHHCDEAQGYYFSHPVAADEFASIHRQGIHRQL